MRRFMTRVAAPAALFAGGAVLVSLPAAGQIIAQQAVPALPAQPPGKEKAKPKAASVEVMTFPSDRDAKNMIQAVKDYMKEFAEKPEKAPWDRICQAAQTVLDAKSDSFFELPKPTPDSPQARVSAKAEINRLIGEFPKEGRQFYQLANGAQAEALLQQARANDYDRAILADISQRYFHTKAGAQATLLLAAVQLERGNFVEAAYSYERLLSRPDSDELWQPLTIFKAIAALKRAGAPENSDVVRKLFERLEKTFPRDGLAVGRRNYTMDELRAEIQRPANSLIGTVSEAYVAMRYGNPSHTGLGDGGKPFLDPTWSKGIFHNINDGNTWVSQNLDEVLRTLRPDKQEMAIPGFFPASAQNLVFLRGYDGIYAYLTKDGTALQGVPGRAGDLHWFAPMKGGAASLVSGSRFPRNNGYRKEDVENYWRYYRDQPALKSMLFENPLTGSLAHDGKAVYVVDEAALPPPPPNNNNEFGGFVPVGGAAAGPVKANGLQDCNFLKAVSIETGELLWTLGETVSETPLKEEDEDKTTNTLLLTQGSFFLGPPLPLNGKLYVLYERNGAIRLACLDPNKILTQAVPYLDRSNDGKPLEGKPLRSYPALVWNQRLGEPNVRLPADTFRRFQCSYLAYSDGVMICPTNAGAVVGVDIMSRSLLWARSYRTLKTAAGGDEGRQPGMARVRVLGGPGGVAAGGQTPLGTERWRAAAPIISQGRVVFAAFDSNDLYCLDLRTGDVLWKEPRRAGDLYVGGVMGDNVLIVNKESMRAVKLAGTPKKEKSLEAKEDVAFAWKDVKIGLPAGHGATSKDGTYYLPVAWTAEDPQPQVWAIDAAKGEVLAKATYRKRDLSESKPMLGNLLFHEDQLYSQSPMDLAVFPLIEVKRREMDKLLAANPNDPAGLVARGEMHMDEGKLQPAVADFTAAAKQGPAEAVLRRLNEKLFLAYTKLLREDFNAAEKFLNEYKALCNVAADAEDPNVKLRQMEENLRRQRLYLELVAKGREKQGRLTEAYDAYREFAVFGGSKELVSLSDESWGKTRPDVWARGRIEAMIRNAKDDSARKPLQDLVDREWAAVKDGKDTAKLREFVNIFGQHFGVGRQAELILGERLMASENPEDHREAYTVLSRLTATAEEADLAARALEGLAKLATKKGQSDTAVTYYVTLGTKYAATTLRPGVTGADLLNDLLTDKRLLPHLEPARLPTPAKIKAVEETTNNGVYVPPGYVLEPDGAENEPFYRRHRVMLSNNDGGNGWALRVHDRGSGEEKWKIGGLTMYNPTGAINYRIAQARGSLLLLHMGLHVVCFDLAEKKRLWEYPIFGEGHRIDMNNIQVQAGPDEELIMTLNQDGTKFTIGRTTVLESNYVALVTRDGLVALDPATKSKLWARSNISPSSIIFGDARHIFVVETTGGKTASKVLRAVDGTVVADVPDFAALATGSGRVRISGRNLLLSEGGRLKPLTLRLHDPLTGKDVWKKEYAPVAEPEDYKSRGLEFNGQAKLIKTFNPELTGAFGRDGTFEVLSVQTGEVVFKGKIDEKNAELHAGMTGQPVLLADADRFYLVLNKTTDANNRNNYMYNSLRVLPVSGPIYCFERATGRRTWFTDKLFENQQLIVERFSEMPALVSATHMQEEDENGVPMLVRRNAGGGMMIYRVAVVDKVNGRLRLFKNMNQNGNFYAIDTNPRKAEARLLRGDLNIVISPDDGATGTPKVAGNDPRPNLPTPPPPK